MERSGANSPKVSNNMRDMRILNALEIYMSEFKAVSPEDCGEAASFEEKGMAEDSREMFGWR